MAGELKIFEVFSPAMAFLMAFGIILSYLPFIKASNRPHDHRKRRIGKSQGRQPPAFIKSS